jgi:hypothetical protein
MPARHAYTLTLPAPLAALNTEHPTGGLLRHPAPEDAERLAELLLDAYQGTIDYDGETTDDALTEIESYFAGRSGEPLPGCSWVYASTETLLAACLVALHEGAPLLAYVMTRRRWKGRGLAAYLVRQSLLSLQDAHYPEVRAVVTEGNVPSEYILATLGFRRAPP